MQATQNMLRSIFGCVGLVVALLAGACTLNPETGRQQFILISPEQEVRLGNEAAGSFIRDNGGEVPSEAVGAYVSRLGHRLVSQSRRSNLPWKFHTLDSKTVNAFALPGGKVFVTRGMLEKLDNEAQLVGVLGHEIGHVSGKHVADRMTQALLLQAAAVGLGVAGRSNDEDWLHILGVGTQIGGTVYLLKYSRDQEFEADRLAIKYMADLGYNPVGHLQVMEILQQENKTARGAEFLSTHPYPKRRIRRLSGLIRKHYPNYEDPAAFQFGFDEYRTQVLDRLKALPPPKHEPRKSKREKERVAGSEQREADTKAISLVPRPSRLRIS